MLAYVFEGSSPRVDLIARRDDDAYYVIFRIDSRQQLLFQTAQGEPMGGADTTVAYVVVRGATGDLLEGGSASSASPPLETIRVDEHSGAHAYEILGASDEFRAREKAHFDMLESRRYDPIEVATPKP